MYAALMFDRPSWDCWFLEIVQVISKRADCRRRQHGAVIVSADHRILSAGYNGAPPGEPGCLSGACPRGLLSYADLPPAADAGQADYDVGPGACISNHAEMNALLWAGREARGATLYVTGEPCPTCAKAVRGAGIVRVVYPGCA